MSKELKDLSTKLIPLATKRDFKVFFGKMDEDTACICAGDYEYFDKYGAGKIILVNESLEDGLKRVAIAQALKTYQKSFEDKETDFYIELKVSDLSYESVLGILMDKDTFEKEYAKREKELGRNEAVMTLSKEFNVKPSLVAKYVAAIRK